MRQYPLVSVIIPAYNAADFIGQTLDSARAQTYEHLEIIVVDDGSNDETPQIVASAAQADTRIKLIRQPNRGVAAARNRAIRASKGAFIAPLDADDLWFPSKIERQVQCMRRGGSSVGLVYAWWTAVNEEDDIIGAADRWTVEGNVLEVLIYRNFIGNASVPLFRRACLEEVGLYDTTLKARGGQGCEDWDLTLRIAEHYDVRCVPAYLSGYRAVADSMSWNCRSMQRSYEFVIGAIERRHPELPSDLFQWSRSNFYLYLASLSYSGGGFRQTLHWLREVVRIDPAALLSTWVVKTALKSAIRHAARPIISLLWKDRQAWLRFKRRVLPGNEQSLSLEQLQQNATSVPESWAWKAWKPYDSLCLWRWNCVVENSECAEVDSPSSENGHPESQPIPSST